MVQVTISYDLASTRCRSLRSRKRKQFLTLSKARGRDEWLVYYFPEQISSSQHLIDFMELPRENETGLFFLLKSDEGGPSIVGESILPVYLRC
jgi:hypothetical protein